MDSIQVSARYRPGIRAVLGVLSSALLLLLVIGSDSPSFASHSGGMDAMSIDMDPAATPANTATSLGTRESCARVNENNLMDADEDSVDTLNVDVTATNIPAGTSMLGFSYDFGYSEANLTVQNAAHNFLLVASPGSALVDGSQPLPDTNGNDLWVGTAVDVGVGTEESGSGVLSRIQLSSDPGATPGVYPLTLGNAAHIDSFSFAYPPDAINNALVAVDTGCPSVGPYTVDTTSDALLNACTGAAADCSLRGAISNAAAFGTADTITFDAAALDDNIESLDAGGDTGLYTSIALDASGNPVIAYKEVTLQDLKVIHCDDPKCTGGGETITSPDTSGAVGNYSSLALDASGNPVVAYEDFTAGDLNVLHCGNANCTAGNSITAPDPTAAGHGRYNSLVLDASGNPVVSYWDVTNSDLKVIHCNDANCSGGGESITSPDTGGEVGRFTSIALDGTGNPVVAYYDVTNGNLKLLHCGNANCTAGNSITSPDTSGDVGSFTSLALDASGFPVIAYSDSDTSDLKIMHCNDANCSGGGESVTSADTANVGIYNSLKLDLNGYPVVSYYEGSPGLNLKLMHCNDANCSGGDESFVSPDTAGNVGQYTSLELDGAGNPVVSYYDASPNFNLKLLHCGGANCDGTATIGLGAALPDLSNTGDTVDATTALVEIRGAGGAFNCFTISGSDNAIVGIELITNCADAVLITGANNVIGGGNASESGGDCGNGLDDDADGYVNDGCPQDGASSESGVQCTLGDSVNDDGGDDSSVNDGCPPRGQGITMNGNNSRSVEMSGAGATGNKVLGSYIGVDQDGVADAGNLGAGVRMENGASNNFVGGVAPEERNVISGNGTHGVNIVGVSSTGNTVINNYIGTDATGTAGLPNADSGVNINSPGNTIGGNTAAERNVISGNTNSGVWISNATATGNVVSGNYIGLNAAGTASIPNVTGVRIDTSAASNTIGGDTVGHRNIISGNTNDGITFIGTSTTLNVVKGNYLGTNPAGTSAIGNGFDGIHVQSAPSNTIGPNNLLSGNTIAGVNLEGSSASGNQIIGNLIGTNATGDAAVPNNDGVFFNGSPSNTIGGDTAAERNVISGNTTMGVYITGAASTGNAVSANYIGTNAAGTASLQNSIGVAIENGADSNSIGGATAAERNVISGNFGDGVIIDGSGSNVIQGNYIGTDATGTAALGNSSGGVVIFNGSTGNIVGGNSAGERNVISGNAWGIRFSAAGNDGNVITGNYVGTAADGTSDMGNISSGIQLNSTGNTIGGTAAGEGNIVAFNGLNGVDLLDTGTTSANEIRGNSIHSNGSLGIDLRPLGVTANDAGDGDAGANNLQNFPVISSVVVGSTTISGTLDTPSPETAFVDVYASVVADGSGNGEGRTFLGTAIPDTFGAWSLTLPGVPPTTIITATATKGGSTSEFSAAYTVSGSPEPGLPSTAIAYKGQASPIGSTYNFFGPGQVPNTTGEVVFWSALASGTQGIFHWISPGPATKLVATGDAAPGGGTFTDLTDAPVVNASGDIAFWGATSAPTEGIYRTLFGAITKLVGVGDAAPGGSTFSSFDPPSGKGVAVINNNGDVSFWAALASGGQGVYLRKSDGTLLKVAATGDPTPAGGTFSTFLSGLGFATIPIVTDNQQVAFRGFTTGGPALGVFLYSQGAGLTKVAATGESSPAGGTYDYFGRVPSPDESGRVAFFAGLSGSPRPSCPSTGTPCGVFIWAAGTSTKAFASGDAASPQTGGLINDLGQAPFMNDTGQITVWAGITSGLASQAIVRYTAGNLENVAAIGNPTAIGGTFSDFIDPSTFPTAPIPNNEGRVVYWGDVTGGSGAEGIFITDAPTSASQTVAGPVAGGPAPGTNGGTFGSAFDLGINRDGTAVFANEVTGGTASSGIFLFFAGQPDEDVDVALQGQDAPGGGTFDQFSFPVNNDNGQIAAIATTSSGPSEGLYLFFAGTAQRMAASGETAPGGGGTYLFFAGSPSINNAGQVASVNTLSGGGSGLYLFFAGSALPGVPCQNVSGFQQCLLALATGAAPGGGTYLFFAGSPSINDTGRVAQRATLGSGEGLYLFFAGSTPTGGICQLVNGIRQCKLASTGDPVPGGGTFSAFGNPAVNNNDQVVASATVSGGTSGLFLFFAGQPTTRLASVGDTAAGSSIAAFSDAVINDSGVVVARATLANGKEGLFLFFAGNPTVNVAVEGDPAATGSGTYGGSPPVFPYMAMNNGAQVVFVANVTGGTTPQGVFVASMDYDGDGVLDFLDNCPTLANTDQNNTDQSLKAAGWNVVADGLGNACDPDDDGDGLLDTAEPSISCRLLPDCDYDGQLDILEGPCGSDPTVAGSTAERVDGVFAGVDDDGDTQTDEALPSGAEDYDCDGDGYKGSAEAHIFNDTNVRDQDPCGTDAWPSDFVSGGIFGSTNKVLIDDLNTFLSPRRLDTNPGDPNYAVRWDLSPGSGIFGTVINIADMNALLGGPTAFPPMLGGARALGGPECPWPP